MAALLRQPLVSASVPNIDVLAATIADHLVKNLQGQRIYFPRRDRQHIAKRNQQINQLYRQGVSTAELSKRFGICRSMVSKIVYRFAVTVDKK